MRAVLTWLLTLIASISLAAQQPETFGTGVSLTETTPLAQVIDSPATFEGRTIRIEGTVSAVCMHMGCWMALTQDKAADSRTLLIKVDDGVIVFPPSAKGRRAVVQGVVERTGSTREGQEAATEQARATGSSAPTWQLKATGASVY